jgi:hypothetical protein
MNAPEGDDKCPAKPDVPNVPDVPPAVTTHRWSVYKESPRQVWWGRLLLLIRLVQPVPQTPSKALNARWDACASWVGFAGAAACLASRGTSVLHKGLSLQGASDMALLLFETGATEILTYWVVRSPLWFGGLMYLLYRGVQ